MISEPDGRPRQLWRVQHGRVGLCILRAVPSSEAVTRGVRVVVNARYSASHSDPAKREWFFLYTVIITNEGEDTVQLVNRHWVIMNANGHVEEVRGPGVVGARLSTVRRGVPGNIAGCRTCGPGHRQPHRRGRGC